jgi:hypothetical protein
MLQDNLTTDMSSPPSVLLVIRLYLDDSHPTIYPSSLHVLQPHFIVLPDSCLTMTADAEADQHRLKDTIQRDSHSRSHRTLLTVRSICNYIVARTKDALDSVSIRAMKKATKYSHSILVCKTHMITLFQDKNECMVLL